MFLLFIVSFYAHFQLLFILIYITETFFPSFPFSCKFASHISINKTELRKKKFAQPEESFNFISQSIPTFYFLSPGTSLALILTETYLFRRIILRIFEVASTPGNA